MKEFQSSQQINSEASDDFYEKIEAPKFVDLSVPDPYRPDDRYWFCLRVGCDQKHEEELDSEAIYKNFVLRVMAARSPNVRLRKALNKKTSSTTMKCPLSAPAKSSKARVSRLAVVSFSQKIGDTKVKVRPLPNQSSTPNAKAKLSSTSAKALTTPRNKKCLPNPNSFRSVQNPKATIIQLPKNRVVAKALVFHSPKKTIRSKALLELDTPVKKICEGMKKLEITSQRKRVLGYSCKSSKDVRRALNKPFPLKGSSMQLNERKVKSQAENSLYSQSYKGQNAKSSRRLKRKSKDENLQKCREVVPSEGLENDASDMEIDGKSRDGSLEECSRSGSSKCNEENGHEKLLTTEKSLGDSSSTIPSQEKTISSLEQPPFEENSDVGLSDASRGDMNSLSNSERDSDEIDVPKFQALNGQGDGSNEESEHEENTKSSSEKGKFSGEEPPENQTLEGARHDSEHEEKTRSSSEKGNFFGDEPPENQISEGAGHDSEHEEKTKSSSEKGKFYGEEPPENQTSEGAGHDSEHEEKTKSSSEKGNFSGDEPPENQTSEGAGHDSEHEEKTKSSSEKGKFYGEEPPENQTSEGAGHDSEYEEKTKSSSEKGNFSGDEPPENQTSEVEGHDSDDKENASASDENRELNLNTNQSGRKLLGKHKTCENNQKVARTLNKTLKEGLTFAAADAQVVKYKKPKPTNPKPFRLRTDERGILKEANLERRLHLAPTKEASTFPRFPSAKSQRRHENDIQRNRKCLEQSKYEKDTNEVSEEGSQKITQKNQTQQIRTAFMKTSKGKVEPKIGRNTPDRRTTSTNQKLSLLISPMGCSRDTVVQKSENSLRKTKSENSLRKTKSLSLRQHGVTPTRKAMISPMTPCRLGVIKEMSPKISRLKEGEKPSESGAIPTTKASASTASRSLSRGRRPATIPKEPNFHRIHVPKSCTRKLE